ncbi:MAG: hypothetical protein Roseis2KO_49280 [Roseivirga sp.]
MVINKLFILVFLFPAWTVLAQSNGESEFSVEQAQNQEIYIQFDKPFYLSGETVWHSLFNITADAHRLIFGRRFMELALIDRNKQIVIKERIKVEDGRSAGQNVLHITKGYLPTSVVDCPGYHNVTLENNCFNCTSVSAIFNSTSKPSCWR